MDLSYYITWSDPAVIAVDVYVGEPPTYWCTVTRNGALPETAEPKTITRVVSLNTVPERNDKFNDIYNRYRKLVRSIVTRRIKNESIADEVQQCVWTAIWEQIDEAQPETQKSWVAAIAQNQASTRLRSEYQRTDGARSLDELSQMERSDDFLDRRADTTPVIDPEQISSMRDAIAQLTPAQQHVVIAHYYADQPVAEIAEEMEVAVGTVTTLLCRARKSLKFILEKT